MTRTVLIEGLIDTLKGIANKISNNPTNSHLKSNVTSETTSVLLTGAAKNTALKQVYIGFEPYQRDTPSTENPATIFAPEFYDVFVSENEIIPGEEPVGEFHAYAINLGRQVYGGIIDLKNKRVQVTWEYIESYDGETLPAEWLSTMDVYAEGTTPTTGAGVAYKIAEPYYIDIEGTTIKTISAANDCYVTGDTYFTKSIEVSYVRDEALAIETLEQQGGGGFAPTLLGTFTGPQFAGTELEIDDCSNYSWLIVEFEKPNESMAGYNGPFRKTIWIPTDSMTEGSTQEVGVAYNEVSATSMAVTAILPMVSIKDSTHIYIVAQSNFDVSRVWGV